MIKLDLQTNDTAEERVKTYLEENASEELARKINEGVLIQKDGKTLRSKKTLRGFIRYATEEAKKTAQKGSTGAFVDDNTVFGWAVHYFEEDAIEGELFNEDGTPYEKPRPKVETKPYVPPAPKPKEPTLFDLIEESETHNEVPPVEVEQKPSLTQEEPKKEGCGIYQEYLRLKKGNPGTIVALRLGDFFEVFGEDARTLAEAIELTLTSRDVGLDERVPMCGIPYHVMDNYYQKAAEKGLVILAIDGFEVRLYRKGEKPQICDMQTGEIKRPDQTLPTQDPLVAKIVTLFDGELEVLL